MDTTHALEILNPTTLLALDTKPFEAITTAFNTMARPRFLAMLNQLAQCLEDGEIFLECGTYKGGSLIGTLLGNQARGWAVDNFSEFEDDPEVKNIVTLEKNLTDFGVQDRVTLNQMDFKDFFSSHSDDMPPVGLYYYDANHGRQATFEGLAMGIAHVVDGGFMVVDDIGFDAVSDGVNSFLGAFSGVVRVVFASSVTKPPALSDEWWNGIMVLQRMTG